MKSYRLFLIALIVAMTTACFNRDRQPIYVESEELPEIEVPQDLSLPFVRQTYTIPGTFLPELAAVGDESRPPVVLSSAEAEASRSHIRFGNRGLYLEVEDEPESVWRRLSFTLNRGGMDLRRANEDERRYRFYFTHDPIEIERNRLARLAFWRSDEYLNFSGEYQVEVREDSDDDRTQVILVGEDGEVLQMDRAEFVLAVLRERLG